MENAMMIEWWHWAIAGLVLVVLELAIPSFFVLWFGLGALLTALVLYAAPQLGLAGQLGIWAAASVVMALLWFRVFRPSRHKTLIGTAAGEVIGEIGLLVSAVAPFQRGKVRFQRPVLGAEEWACMAEAEIAAGERVRVVSVEGSFVKVAKA
ncbi:NfeD family protein [Pseudothauera nasutitermitis]|uniref:NfeD family protein n=2 Tax=Pseudothauera nasutitermitis TaxID=2565930 RepID=A0A4S4B0X7_9RHOO|nr:NfeD family protein [Pseudothauera nasutitermitis]THF64528.1 NfeD family protein [Pseudothauera nasutitermitis]